MSPLPPANLGVAQYPLQSTYSKPPQFQPRIGENAPMIGEVEAEKGRITKLEKHSVKVVCSNCKREIFTSVEKKISGRGVLWAVLCCFFLSFYLSLLALFMDVFKEFTHYCPSCSSIIGRY